MARPIAQSTAQAYAMINPDEALQIGDERYVSLDTARGTRNIAQLIVDMIAAREASPLEGNFQDYARLLVTGHRGSGKTTELYRLQDLLVKAGFAVVYFDAGVEFDMQKQNIDWWSLLLEMIWQIDEQLGAPPYGITIPQDLRDDAVEWLARVVTEKTERVDMETSLTTDFEIGSSLPFFAKAKAAIKALVKAGSSTVKKIEQEVEHRPTMLHHSVDEIISHVQDRLSAQGKRGLVIIADGLEKMPLRKISDQLTTHNALFIHNGRHLKAPPCHLIYTLPLALLISANIGQVFSEQPILMPMVRIRHRDGETEGKRALRAMSGVVTQRVAPSLFAPGVIKMLALASGGHLRDFLRLVQEAASGFGKRITKTDAKRAITGMIDLYNRTIDQKFIAPLGDVAQHGELPGGPYDSELINLLLVLEYRNAEAWTALHPCVQVAPRYLRSPRVRQEEKD